jgi:hypothetical protein
MYRRTLCRKPTRQTDIQYNICIYISTAIATPTAVAAGHSHATDGHSHPTDGHSHSTDGHSHPTDGHSHSTDGHSHPTDGHSHPTDGHSHSRISNSAKNMINFDLCLLRYGPLAIWSPITESLTVAVRR